jgi:hypothetical protein
MRRRRALPSLLLVVLVAAVYLANGRQIGAGDTAPARVLPWALMHSASANLDAYPMLYTGAMERVALLDGVPYFLRYEGGHYRSAYGVGPALFALPVFAAPILAGVEPDSPWAVRLEKLAAALITALSVAVLHGALRPLLPARWALAFALVYAFATSSWSISSQALWQHGPSQLCIALVLYGLVHGLTRGAWPAWIGAAMSAAALIRPTNALLLLPLAAWIVAVQRRRAARFVAAAVIPLVVFALLDMPPLTSAGIGRTSAPPWALFVQTPWLEGLAGVLASPSRGLFVYSPVLLFSVWGMAAAWRSGSAPLRALIIGVVLVVLTVAKWFIWWGGRSYGPRLLADLTPVLCFFLFPVAAALRRSGLLAGIFWTLVTASVGAHALGAFFYDGSWEAAAAAEGRAPDLWSWSRGPLAFYGTQALDGLHQLAGGEDRPTSADAPDSLEASYRVAPLPEVIGGGVPIEVEVQATNTGGALWRATPRGGVGAVRLGWVWRGSEKAADEGRLSLAADVRPGETAHFHGWITAPSKPGDYTLVLGLVSEPATWFADGSSPPITRAFVVRPLNAADLVVDPDTPNDHPLPALAVTTDRRVYRSDDAQEIRVDLWNPGPPNRFDAFLLMEGPDGALLFYDGHRPLDSTRHDPRPWVRALPLPSRAAGRFTVAPASLSPGAYRWHVVLRKGGTSRVVAHAVAEYSIAP